MNEELIRVRRVKRVTDEASGVAIVSEEETIVPMEEAVDGLGETSAVVAQSMWYAIGRWCVYAVIGLAPLFFLPLTNAPVEISKTVLVFGLTVLALVSFLVTVIESRSFAYPRSKIMIAAIAVLIATAISAGFSVARPLSFFGGLIEPDAFAMIAAYVILAFLVFYFLSRGTLAGYDYLARAGRFFLGGMAAATAIALLQAFGSFIFPWAFTKGAGFTTFGSLSTWGIMMGAALSLLAVLSTESLSRRTRISLFFSGALFLFGLLVINYSLLWVALALIMVIISAARFVAHERLGWPLLLGVMALFAALISPHIPRLAPSLPTEVRPAFSTSLGIVKDTLFSRRVLVGSGPGTFAYSYDLHRPASINQTNFFATRFGQGYDALVTAAANIGLLGLLAVLFLAFAVLRGMLILFTDPQALPVIAGTLFLMVSGLFFPISFITLLYIFLGLGLILIFSGSRREVSFEHLPASRSFLSFMFAVFLVAASLSSFYFLGQKYYAAVAYGKSVERANASDSIGAVTQMASAIRWDAGSDAYWRAMSQVLLLRAGQIANDENGKLELQKTVSDAITSARRATELNPVDSANWSNAGSVYEAIAPRAPGAEKFAVENYQEAMKRDPQNPQEPVNAARTLIAAASSQAGAAGAVSSDELLNQAKGFLDRSVALKSDYAPAHYLMAQILIREGNIGAALLRTEAIAAQSPYDAGLAFQLGLLYYQNNRFDEARTNFERAVAVNPDYANAKYFLGLIYDKAGMGDKAIEQFQRIADLNPDNAEVKSILANLRAGRHALESIVPPAAPPQSRPNAPVKN